MTDRQRMWAARLIGSVAVIGAGVGGVASTFVTGNAEGLGFAVVIGFYGVVGAVLIARVPGNRLGWAFGGIGTIMQIGGFQDFARPLLDRGVAPGLVAVGQAAADLSWGPGVFFIMVLLPAWFPDGRPLSPRWAWAVRVGAAAWIAWSLLALLSPEKAILWEGSTWVTLDNPIGFSWVPDFEDSALATLAFAGTVAAGVASLSSLFVRYRRADRLERLQIRWLRAAVVAVFLTTLLGGLVEAIGVGDALSTFLFLGSLLSMPTAAVIAITRNHLYDLDRVVSRTVTFGLVVGGLGALFALGAVWLPQRLAGTGNSLAVAATTLVVFVLFNPLRRRVQGMVERRFNRLPYDPSAVSATLARRLRESIEPGEVSTVLTNAVSEHLQPASFAVWINGGSHR